MMRYDERFLLFLLIHAYTVAASAAMTTTVVGPGRDAEDVLVGDAGVLVHKPGGSYEIISEAELLRMGQETDEE